MEVSAQTIEGISKLGYYIAAETEDKDSGDSGYKKFKNATRTLDMDVVLRADLNVDVRSEIDAWMSLCAKGYKDKFYVSGTAVSSCTFLLTGVKADEISIAPDGTWKTAEMRLEFAQSAGSSGSSSSSSSGGKSSSNSSKSSSNSGSKKASVKASSSSGTSSTAVSGSTWIERVANAGFTSVKKVTTTTTTGIVSSLTSSTSAAKTIAKRTIEAAKKASAAQKAAQEAANRGAGKATSVKTYYTSR